MKRHSKNLCSSMDVSKTRLTSQRNAIRRLKNMAPMHAIERKKAPQRLPKQGKQRSFPRQKRNETKEMMSDRRDGLGLHIFTRKAYYTVSTSPAWKMKKS